MKDLTRFIIIFLSVLGIFLSTGCDNSSNSESLSSNVENKPDCQGIDTYYDCISRRISEMVEVVKLAYEAGQDSGQAGRQASQEIGDQCLREQGKASSTHSLDSAITASSVTNECKNEVTNFIDEHDFMVQLLYCQRQKIKESLGCPL